MRKILIALLILTASGFIWSVNDTREMNKLIEESDGNRLELVMSTWFVEFDNQQREGKTMFEADKAASALTLELIK